MTARWLDHSIPLCHQRLDWPESDGPSVIVTCGDPAGKPDLGFAANGAAASDDTRQRLAEAFGVSPDRLVFMEQTHGSAVIGVDGSDAGAGLLERRTALPSVDAMVTTEADLVLVALSADCPLVALWDGDVVGLAHCGWRSLAGGVIAEVVAAMVAAGAAPGRMWATVGPSIGPCCYEIGPEVGSALTQPGIGLDEHLQREDGTVMADLPRVACHQLEDAGVQATRISASTACTRCDDVRYHSYRRDGAGAGRQAMAICRKDEGGRG